DGQHQRAVNDAAIEPVRQHELHALDAAGARRQLLPFIHPRELMAPPMLALPYGGSHGSGLQPGERRLEQTVVAGARLPPDGGQQMVWREAQEPRCGETTVLRFDDLS